MALPVKSTPAPITKVLPKKDDNGFSSYVQLPFVKPTPAPITKVLPNVKLEPVKPSKTSGGGSSSQPVSSSTSRSSQPVNIQQPTTQDIKQSSTLTSQEVQQNQLEAIQRQQAIKRLQEQAQAPVRNIQDALERQRQEDLAREEQRLRSKVNVEYEIPKEGQTANIKNISAIDVDALTEESIYGGRQVTREAAQNVLVERKKEEIVNNAKQVAQDYIDSKRLELQDYTSSLQEKYNLEYNKLSDDYFNGKINQQTFENNAKIINSKYTSMLYLKEGEIGVIANAKARDYANKELTKLNQDISEIKYKEAVGQLPKTFAEGIVLGSVLPVGRVAQVGYTGLLGYQTGEVAQQVVSGDIQGAKLSLLETGTSLLGAGIGGAVKARSVNTEKIRLAEEAFGRSKAIEKDIAYGVDSTLRKLNVNEQTKLELKDYASQGFQVRLKEIIISADTSTDQAIINRYKPKAYVVEVIGRDGGIVKAYGSGDIYIKDTKGNVINTKIKETIVGGIKDKTFYGIADIVELNVKKNKSTPINKSKNFIKSEITEQQTVNDVTRTKTSSELSLLEDTSIGIAGEPKGDRENIIRLRNIVRGLEEPKVNTKSQSTRFSLLSDRAAEGMSLLGTRETFFGETKGRRGFGFSESAKKSEEFSLLDRSMKPWPKNEEITLLEEPKKNTTTSPKQENISLLETPKEIEQSKSFEFDLLTGERIKENIKGKAKDVTKTEFNLLGSTKGLSLLAEEPKTRTTTTTKGRDKAGDFDLFGTTTGDFNLTDNKTDIDLFSGLIDSTDTSQRQDQQLRQQQVQRQELDFGLDLGFDFQTPDISTPKPPKLDNQVNPPSLFDSLDNQAYDVYALKDGSKPSKSSWKKLNKEPLTKDSALDLGSYNVDNSVSARFKIKPTKGNPVSLDDTNISMSWENNQSKFRSFKQKQGQRISLMDEYIENSTHRIDTKGEKKDLSLAKINNSFWGKAKNRIRRGFSLW